MDRPAGECYDRKNGRKQVGILMRRDNHVSHEVPLIFLVSGSVVHQHNIFSGPMLRYAEA